MRSPATEVIISTHPWPFSRMPGIASCVRCSGASTCISVMRRARFSGNSSSGRRKVTAALLTRMSGAPTCSITSAIIRSRSSVSTRRPAPRWPLPPAATISSSVSRNDPTYLSSGSIVRAVSATVAPSAAKRFAIDLPSPRLAPVTNCDLACTCTRHDLRYYARARTCRSASTTSALGSRRSVPTRSPRSPVARRASPTRRGSTVGASS